MASNQIFTLVNLSPIGFKEPNYPVPFCSLCRGRLNDVCGQCLETKSSTCNVINTDGSYFHQHCHALVRDDKPKAKGKAKCPAPQDYSESESE